MYAISAPSVSEKESFSEIENPSVKNCCRERGRKSEKN